jgi:dienelactone hydrolase
MLHQSQIRRNRTPGGRARCAIWGAIMLLPVLSAAFGVLAGDTHPAERVTFPSAVGDTTLVGYLFEPANAEDARHPAVVLMHGRGGAYSTSAKGVYGAATLSARHKAWGDAWAAHGYIALLVDGFGPRGHAQGFPRYSYDQRPAELNEVTKRPFDAYAALAYLRSRADVAADRIGLMGWSNGASATLAAMARDVPELKWPNATPGFRAALAFYPGCGLRGTFEERPFLPYAPVLILHGTADEEVSSERCVELVEESRAGGGTVDIELFEDATHGFDSPTRNRQALAANRTAAEQATGMALAFFNRHVKGQPGAVRGD